jgi:quercetin dioxygenase-like cupin family protein
MSRRNLGRLMIAALAAGAFFACSEEAPVAPGAHGSHDGTADVGTLALPEFFTFRATLDPYQIHQLPDFMIHSTASKQIVMQRSQFPATTLWHTHPGPSFVGVIEGQVRIERVNEKDGCTLSPLFVPGDAYIEIANEVHRLVLVSSTPAVLVVTRFNIPTPVGGVEQPFTITAADQTPCD